MAMGTRQRAVLSAVLLDAEAAPLKGMGTYFFTG
jgi:hypothetical protein